jgi:RNase adaptor protein for sRNA GlmZ degradation
MRWPEVCVAHPDQWLVIESLDAHSENDHRIFDRIAVIDVCADGRTTMKRYSELRRQHPHREFCFVHTSMVELKIEERLWLGIRGLRATDLTA